MTTTAADVLRAAGSRPGGLSAADAARRLDTDGPNELTRRAGRTWPRQLARQVTHPLALLLWLAAGLSFVSGTTALGVAIVAVVALNAVLAFVQERHAEHAVEALAAYLPSTATVVRDGRRATVDVREVVRGDVLVLDEGERVPADVRLVDGAVEVDQSALTGESLPVFRCFGPAGSTAPLEARDRVFSGATVTGGEATAVVLATGMRTELGRIAALSQRVTHDESPLERQIKRVAWMIAAVAAGAGLAFLPLGALVAGLPVPDAVNFGIGLLVANVPEGLLPTITLALAVGVRALARGGAVAKRLSAVETLGCTTVICTDKTGTLTENRMRVVDVWLPAGPVAAGTPATDALTDALTACGNAELDPDEHGQGVGDPTEIALLTAAADLGADVSPGRRDHRRARVFAFDPQRRLMTTVDRAPGAHGRTALVVHTKGAPEEVLARTTTVLDPDGVARPWSPASRAAAEAAIADHAARGLRLIAVARRVLRSAELLPADRDDAERDLTLVGVVALLDPPRARVADAVARCRAAGIRIVVLTGDHGLTALQIAQQVGIGDAATLVVTGTDVDALTDADLADLLRPDRPLIVARSSPETKLRVADALRGLGHVVAMTGDGANDAPALRRADIGIAMGRAGTDVAREAATMVLVDDDFSTIVTAIESGRRVYANVRKFIVYIFAHATPEVVPYLLFALSGGAIPLPLTVLQILAIDLGTETVPAVALGRETVEPGLMDQPPRRRADPVVDRAMLTRAWLLLGGVSTVLVLGGFLLTLLAGGWTPGAPTGPESPLHHVWRQATTMTFLGIVACQIGTAFASRTQRAALRAIGPWSNRLLLWGIVFEVGFAVAVVTVAPLQAVFGTALPPWPHLLVLPLFPLVVWGADELWRAHRRTVSRPGRHPVTPSSDPQAGGAHRPPDRSTAQETRT